MLDDLTDVGDLPGDYARLAEDTDAQFGIPPVVGTWRQTNASRYVRRFQSRRAYAASHSVRHGLLVHLCDHFARRF